MALLILQGEADLSTLQHLETALSRLDLTDIQAVHLDLSELQFADVATIRELAVFARQAKQAGRTVLTCGASPTLRKVASILHFHIDLGLLGA
jgi:anti-anti-sigma regulatory factor